MLGDITHLCTLNEDLNHTSYLFGNLNEIAGKQLKVLEQNKYGDCLCITEKGLVDVDHRDIKKVIEIKSLPNMLQRLFFS